MPFGLTELCIVIGVHIIKLVIGGSQSVTVVHTQCTAVIIIVPVLMITFIIISIL